jgi:hypothetical protein
MKQTWEIRNALYALAPYLIPILTDAERYPNEPIPLAPRTIIALLDLLIAQDERLSALEVMLNTK